MIHALTYSIIRHLDTQVPELTKVIWMYDGVTISTEVKPFAIVEQMREYNNSIASGRNDFEDSFGFQIGLYANSVSERSKLNDKMKIALRNPAITYYDTSGPTPVSTGFFVCNINMITPIPVEDSADNTNKHRLYFDVRVEVYRASGDAVNFTQ